MSKLEEKYYLLRELEKDSGQSQRSLSKQLGMSLGKINFLLQALIEKGVIKIENFAHSQNKLKYRYILTPHGLKEKVQITRDFIRRKEKEYESIQEELEEAKRNIPDHLN